MLLAAVLGLVGCVCGPAGHRERSPRRWAPQLVMAAAMVAMALPEGTDPLGPLGWCLALTATATAVAWQDLPLAERLPVAYDLLGMAGLLFVQWRAALDGGTEHTHAMGICRRRTAGRWVPSRWSCCGRWRGSRRCPGPLVRSRRSPAGSVGWRWPARWA
ncbi:hypothetical protein SAMN04487983_105610 [Streptomyces sp. yr375]|uniref:hypothetical protein n=1 Tax=Streptomyces sp. yr375 TaxID=1761906 RepID=UPI0008B78C4F|nr:hypothetical protein [Streptomyces sp. yr375]SES44700.1 hypothetical protein SAMN04487983_105610 [Streptomyces sp. yr375]